MFVSLCVCVCLCLSVSMSVCVCVCVGVCHFHEKYDTPLYLEEVCTRRYLSLMAAGKIRCLLSPIHGSSRNVYRPALVVLMSELVPFVISVEFCL